VGCWQSRDFERAQFFLSDELKKTRKKEQWDSAICGVSNPHHAAYEIGKHERIASYRYRFEVWLHEHYTGASYRKFKRGKPLVFECEKQGDYYRITEVPEATLFGADAPRVKAKSGQ